MGLIIRFKYKPSNNYSMAIDIYTLLFEEVLQISSSTLSNYATIQDQLLYLVLIPHVILFLFIYGFSTGIVQRVLGLQHHGFKYLVSISVYLFIVLGGWYGSLAPLFAGWFKILLVVGIFFFLLSAIWHPARGRSTGKAIESGFKYLGGQTFGKSGKAKVLDKEIRKLNEQIARMGPRNGLDHYQVMTYDQLVFKRNQLEAERRNL